VKSACPIILSSRTISDASGSVYSDEMDTSRIFSFGINARLSKGVVSTTIDVQDVFAAGATTVDSETNVLTKNTHGWLTGLPGKVSGLAVPSPLVAGTTYYFIRDSANAGKLASSESNAYAGTAIDLTSPTFTVVSQQTFAAAASSTADAATDLITKAAHGFITGLPVQVAGAVIPAGLSALTTYYVIWVSSSTFKLAASEADAYAGTAIDLTAPTFTCTVQDTFSAKATPASDFNATSNEITEVGHGYITGVVGQFTTDNTLPAGIAALTDHYIIRISDDVYKLALSEADAYAGTAIALTDQGVGNHTFTPSATYSNFNFLGADITLGTDVIAEAAHGLITGLKVRISGTAGYSLPDPLAALTDYFIIDNAAGEVKLATSLVNALAGTAIDLTNIGGVVSALTVTPDTLTFTSKTFKPTNVTIGTDVVAIALHGFITGLKVQITSTDVAYLPPSPLGLITDYFIIDNAAGEIKLATSLVNALAGTAIDLTDTGSDMNGSLTFTPNTLAYADAAFVDAGVDATGDEITTAAVHAMFTGLKVRLVSNSTSYPGGLAAATDYFVIDTGASTLQLAASLSDAVAGTQINITDTGNVPSITTTLQYCLQDPIQTDPVLTFDDVYGSGLTTNSWSAASVQHWSEKSAVPYSKIRLKHVVTGGAVVVEDHAHLKTS